MALIIMINNMTKRRAKGVRVALGWRGVGAAEIGTSICSEDGARIRRPAPISAILIAFVLEHDEVVDPFCPRSVGPYFLVGGMMTRSVLRVLPCMKI